MHKSIPGLVWPVMAMILIWSCSSGNKNDQARNAGARNQTSAASSGGQGNSAGGLVWEAPAAWKVGPPQQMRVVTYLVSPIEDDADNAELAVFHFPGTGGDKESNLQRWEGQFEQPDGRNSADVAVIKDMEVNGLKVTTIDLSGTYKVSGGPMMEVKDKKSGYRLLGAIIKGPQGMVFFKMTGPEKTVAASEKDFMQMVKSTKSVS